MERIKLQKALKLAEPALATKDTLPALMCFFFDGKCVKAYDDVVSITAPCSFEADGGVNGKLFLSWLSASKGKTVSWSVDNEDVIIVKSGRSKLTLPVTPAEDFAKPDVGDESISLDLTEDILMALECASLPMSNDPSVPWLMGVTIEFTNNQIEMFASDNFSLANSCVDCDVPKGLMGRSFVLPPQTVNLILSLRKTMAPKQLQFGTDQDWAAVNFGEKGALEVWSRTGTEVAPEKYRKVLGGFAEIENEIPIPKGFEDALKRALVVLAYSSVNHGKITISNGRLSIAAESPAGKVNDGFKLKGVSSDFEASAIVLLDALLKAVPYTETIAIFDNGLQLAGPGFNFLVSAAEEA